VTIPGVVSVDGVVTPIEEGRVSAMDHGFLFGDSIYEVVRTLGGRPVAMTEHLARLRHSAEMTYLGLPWSDAEFVARIRAAFEASKLADAYVRLVVSRGAGPMTLLPGQCPRPSMIVYVMPLVLTAPAEFERGIGVVVPDRLRNDRRALAPAAKTGNYLNNALALVEAKRAGGDDAVMVNPEGFVTEATTANVFWAKGGRVVTPSHDCGILAGITREALLAAMRREGIETVEGRFAAADFRACDEAFLTGTIRGVSPVVRIDGRAVGDGRPGPLARRAAALNDQAIAALARDW
jgi:branched-chain amino acid aminotransferase